jgi:hypothetical protein
LENDRGIHIGGVGENGLPPWSSRMQRLLKVCRGTNLPTTVQLLKAATRVCKVGSLMFMLPGYQICPIGGLEKILY